MSTIAVAGREIPQPIAGRCGGGHLASGGAKPLTGCAAMHARRMRDAQARAFANRGRPASSRQPKGLGRGSPSGELTGRFDRGKAHQCGRTSTVMRASPSFLLSCLLATLAAAVAVALTASRTHAVGTTSVPTEPTLALAGESWVREGTGTARTLTFQATVAPAAPGPVRFRVRTADGSARAGEDFEAIDRRVTIPAGASSATVVLRTVADAVEEPARESFELEVDEVEGALDGAGTWTVTIGDDDMPAEAGDLRALGCVGGRDATDDCEVETAGFDGGAFATALAGERDLYLTDGASIAHLRRDPASEQLTAAGCLRVVDAPVPAPDCARLPESEGEAPFGSAGITQLRAAPDGRHLHAVLTDETAGTGEPGTRRVGVAVATFAIDPGDGGLTLAGCVGDALIGPACTGGSGIAATPTDWPALSVSPDGRQLYLLSADAIRLLRVGVDGRPGQLRCADSGAPAGDETCAPLLDHTDQRSRATFSPDGARVAVTEQERLRLFARDAATGLLTEQRERVVNSDLAAAAWAPDGETLHLFSRQGDGAVLTYDAATLEQTSCIESTGPAGGPGSGCETRSPLDLRGTTALAVAPGGGHLRLLVPGGGIVTLKRAADGSLSGGRCHASVTDAGTCGDGSGDPLEQRLIADLVTAPEGRAVYALTSRALHRFVPVEPGGANRPPACSDASVHGKPDRELRIPLTCIDPDGDPVTLRITEQPAHGTLGEPDADGVAYRPAAGFRGEDALRFRAEDDEGATADAAVRVTVSNHAPVCTVKPLAVQPGQRGHLDVTCHDADGDRLRTEVVRGPAHGALSYPAYDAPAGWHGTETVLLRSADEWDAVETTATIAVTLPTPGCTPASTAFLEVPGTRAVRRTLDCHSAGLPAQIAIADQTRRLGTARVQSGTLLFTPLRAPTGGADEVTLKLTGADGKRADVQIRVGRPVRTRPDGTQRRGRGGDCRSPCTPDRQGEITFRYFCDGRSVSSAGTCTGSLLIYMCQNGRCTQAVGTATIIGSAVRGAEAPAVARASARRPPRRAARRMVLGRTTVRARVGRSVALKVRLTPAGRRLVARRGKVRALVVLQLRRPGGATRTVTRVITIRAPRRAARRPGAGRRANDVRDSGRR